MDTVTAPSLIDTIRLVLAEEIRHPNMERFAIAARLREDLGIDSVVLMELFVRLETGHGFEVPKTALDGARLITVGDLILQLSADVAAIDLSPRAAPPVDVEAGLDEALAAGGVHGEMPMDIKVHCFASCLCDGLKKRAIDQRPFYAAIPDAEIAVDDLHRLRYHAGFMDHRHFRIGFETLYGGKVTTVVDPMNLIAHLERRMPAIDVMAMVDLHRLPERENSFDRDPFPHYVLIETTEDPMTILMRDVDFRWEGPIAKVRLLNAMESPAVSGGFLIDHTNSREPSPSEVASFMGEILAKDGMPLVAALRSTLDRHIEQDRLSELGEAVAELPILIIRKYAYEHVFAYLWRALRRDTASFDVWADKIERLVQGYRMVHLEMEKLGAEGKPEMATRIREILDRLHDIEAAIRHEIRISATMLAPDEAGEKINLSA
ncbi:hypothetical protein FP2506_16094 [Fulvimarina pelagi HTCC2506]|uniref:Carrier domain-containing protein n=1 Tax=Fulvimarina pelagi HTCC2506 TaxID=314231 RepID=Q0G361_9HYPH|nr:DUF6005 family protein [Fulvimarina pelagi]EAU41970.1 hypothetical protein FP2506_16094 [Fulvimarina pelagi HTCC2506]